VLAVAIVRKAVRDTGRDLWTVVVRRKDLVRNRDIEKSLVNKMLEPEKTEIPSISDRFYTPDSPSLAHKRQKFTPFRAEAYLFVTVSSMSAVVNKYLNFCATCFDTSSDCNQCDHLLLIFATMG
jgi:hypothetical protein